MNPFSISLLLVTLGTISMFLAYFIARKLSSTPVEKKDKKVQKTEEQHKKE